MKCPTSVSGLEITQNSIHACRVLARPRLKWSQFLQSDFSRVISHSKIGDAVISGCHGMPLGSGMMKNTRTTAAFLSLLCGRAPEAKRLPGSFGHRAGIIRDRGTFILGIALLAFSWLVTPGMAADATPPSVPTGVSATAITSKLVKLTWGASTDSGGSGLAGYQVYRNGTLIGTNTAASYLDTGLSPNTQYCYTIVAYDNAGNDSAVSSQACATTLPDTTPPSVPTGVSATAITSKLVKLTWGASTDTGGSGLAGYQVYRNGTLIGTNTVASFLDIGLSPSTEYCYTIVAYDNAGNDSAASSQACVTTPPGTTAPSVPTGVSATAITSKLVKLTWGASTDTGGSGLAGYQVYRNGTLIGTNTVASFLDIGLSPSTQYCYTIVAYDDAGNNSAASSQTCATTSSGPLTPSAPVNLSATAITSKLIKLTWGASTDPSGSGLAGYQVYCNGMLIGTNTAASYLDIGLSPDTQYCYTIVAYDNAGNNSAVSSQACATTQASPSTTGLPVPSGVSATPSSPSEILVTWNPLSGTNGSDVAGDNVYRNGTLVGIATATSYTDEGLSPSAQYCYTVAAYNSAGNESADSAQACATTPTQGVIPTGSLVTWQGNVGVEGGIPSAGWGIYTTLPAGSSLSTINAALSACPSGNVVFLEAGNYYLTNDYVHVVNNFTALRGAGTNTVLYFFSSPSNNDFYADGLVTVGDRLGANDPLDVPGGETSVNWTNGYAQGSSNLVFDSVGGISVGQIICLDQTNNDASTDGLGAGYVQGDPCWDGADQAGRQEPGQRSLEQWVKVMAINGTTVTVWPPLYSGLWSSSQQPQAWWETGHGPITYNAGVEDLKVDGTSAVTYGAGYGQNFALRWTWDCWISGVESYNAEGDHAIMQWGGRTEIRDSYFHVTQNSGGSGSYGVTVQWASGNLLENNIFNTIDASIVLDTVSGSVIGYNYSTNQVWIEEPAAQHAALFFHQAYCYMNLIEGNDLDEVVGDFSHGANGYNTFYRNRITGYDPSFYDGTYKTGSLLAIYLAIKNYAYNIVGNVLGTTGKNTIYESPGGDGSQNAIYAFGDPDTPNYPAFNALDSNTEATVFRNGNYDVVTGGITWSNGFSQTLPSSLYLTNTPSWFNSLSWPPYDPNNPSAASSANLPAGYRFVNGVVP
jgi:chitodextrinase